MRITRKTRTFLQNRPQNPPPPLLSFSHPPGGGALSAVATTAANTPSKSVSRARPSHASENSDPNILASPPPPASMAPVAAASTRKKRSTPAPAPPPPVPQRRFLVPRKGAHRQRHNNNNGDSSGGEFDFDKYREALRASHEEFFLKERAASAATDEEEQSKKEEEEKVTEQEADSGGGAFEEGDVAGLEGSSNVRAIRCRVMAKALTTVPDSGAGRVKHLVSAFESLLSISGDTADAERAGEEAWALPGLQPWKEGGEAVFSSSDFLNLGPSRLCNSLDGKSNRLVDTDTQAGQGIVLRLILSKVRSSL